MGEQKKTMYALLMVPSHASAEEITAAYQRLCQHNETDTHVGADDRLNRRKALDAAYRTLSAPMARQAYDAFLHTRGVAAQPPEPLGLALVDYPAPEPQAMALRAEALSVKAEAMAIKADALMLKADMRSVHRSDIASPWDGLGDLLKRGRAIFFAVIGVWLVFSVLRGMLVPHQNLQAEAQAADKAALQEYFQTYGVRPANMAEMQAMEAARRKEDAEQSAKAREKQYQESERRNFEYESRRLGEQASRSLEEGERQARYAQELEQERKRQAQRDEAQRLEAERERADRNHEQWRQVIRAPSPEL